MYVACNGYFIAALFLLFRNGIRTRHFMEIRTHRSTHVLQWIHFFCISFRLLLLCCCVSLSIWQLRDIQIVICIGAVSQVIHFECCPMNVRQSLVDEHCSCLAKGNQKDHAIASFQWVPPAFDSNYAFQLIYAIAHINNVAVHLFCTLHRCSRGQQKAYRHQQRQHEFSGNKTCFVFF